VCVRARVRTHAVADGRRQNHEIRTPLVGVIGLADVLVATEGLAPSLQEQLEEIRASGKAVLSLINNMLDLSRMDANMLHIDAHVRPQPSFLASVSPCPSIV
jgi:signal transduction histidine kinase